MRKNKFKEMINNFNILIKSKKKLINKINNLQEIVIENNSTMDFLIKENEKNKNSLHKQHKKCGELLEENKKLNKQIEFLTKRDNRLQSIEMMFQGEVDLSKLSKLVKRKIK